jgi:hypothetical protein
VLFETPAIERVSVASLPQFLYLSSFFFCFVGLAPESRKLSPLCRQFVLRALLPILI